MGLPRPSWVRLNRLRTGVGRFQSSMHKCGLAPTSNCECGAVEQTADHYPDMPHTLGTHRNSWSDNFRCRHTMLVKCYHCQHVIQTAQQHGVGKRIDSHNHCCSAAALNSISTLLKKEDSVNRH